MSFVQPYFLSKTKHGLGVLTGVVLLPGDKVWVPDDWSTIILTDLWLDTQDEVLRNRLISYMYSGKGKYLLTNAGYYNIDDSRFMNHNDKPSLIYNTDDECYYAIRELRHSDELTCDYNDFCVKGKYCFTF